MAEAGHHTHEHDHAHDHSLGWRSLLLLLWAVIEISYAAGRSDLVLANGYHDLFDVAFAMVVIYGANSREMFPQWRHVLRCNLGPIVIIGMTLSALVLAVMEVTRPHEGSGDDSLWGVLLLAVSAGLSYNLVLGGRGGRGVWSNILTWHFALDVGGSSIGAVVAFVQLYRDADTAANLTALLILALAGMIGLRIIRFALPLIHLERNCQPAGSGE